MGEGTGTETWEYAVVRARGTGRRAEGGGRRDGL